MEQGPDTTGRRDEARMRELVLYISELSETDEYFGLTKLYKILFYCDFDAYSETGTPLTGQEYQRLDHGPAPRYILPLLKDMIAAGELVIKDQHFHGYSQKKPIALRKADLSAFDGNQIALVAGWVEQAWHLRAADISRMSHDFIGWELATEGETIPYYVALMDDRSLSQSEIDGAASLAETASRLLRAQAS